MAHLIAHGHRRIAFIGDRPAGLYTRKTRQRGYRSALETAGIGHDPALVVTAHDPYAAGVAVRRLPALPDPPTAVFAANNFASLGVVPALAEAGRREVALVGFDDLTGGGGPGAGPDGGGPGPGGGRTGGGGADPGPPRRRPLARGDAHGPGDPDRTRQWRAPPPGSLA